MIPRIDAAKLNANDPQTLDDLRKGAEDIGFLTVHNTAITASEVQTVIDTYRAFFHLSADEKSAVDMARTGSNRGWGAAGSEQVDPNANPDYKQFYDCGFELPAHDPLHAQKLTVYGENQWPNAAFKNVISGYYDKALGVSMDLLRGIARAIGEDASYFDDKFSRPMALLRGNYYPERPTWAGAKDFGIATHTDYGCLTLLATDGTPGLEVRQRGGGWLAVNANPGEFIINFGEMLEMWTNKRVVATPHRVVGSMSERISVPMFFNPNHDANVAPMGSGKLIRAGDHLAKRFEETYLHLQKKDVA